MTTTPSAAAVHDNELTSESTDGPPAEAPRSGDAGQCATPSAAIRRSRRADGVRRAIRSALAGVTLLVATTGVAFAEPSSYTVQSGDTLLQIAARLSISAGDLVRANGLDDADMLQPGQVLRLPGEPERAAPSSRGARSEVPTRLAAKAFAWPLRGVITTPFGEAGALWRRGYHPGLDIAAPVGSRIVSASDGVVVEAESSGYNSGYGSYVKVDHGGGVHTLYAHLARVAVQVGDQVVAGDLVGTVGMTGFTTGPHLHLEVRVNGVIQDPLRWLE